jgi:hypothetical protein
LYLTFFNKYVLNVDLFTALLLQAHISVPHSLFVVLESNPEANLANFWLPNLKWLLGSSFYFHIS